MSIEAEVDRLIDERPGRELLNLPYDEQDGNRKLGEFLADHYDGEAYDEEGARAVAEMKAFLAALKTWDNYSNPVWEGLLQVEDDYSFVRLFLPLLPYMWD